MKQRENFDVRQKFITPLKKQFFKTEHASLLQTANFLKKMRHWNHAYATYCDEKMLSNLFKIMNKPMIFLTTRYEVKLFFCEEVLLFLAFNRSLDDFEGSRDLIQIFEDEINAQ